MKLKVLQASLLSLVILCVAAARAAEDSVSAGDRAVTLAPVTLDIVNDGKKAGSTKVPPGRNVDVLEVQDGRARISAAPLLSGWVQSADLRIIVSDARLPTAEDADRNTESAPAQASAPTKIPPRSIRHKASRITIEETKSLKTIVAEPPSKCRGIEHSFSFRPTITRGEDLADKTAVLRFYVVMLRENEEKTKANRASSRIRIGGESFNVRKKVYEASVRQMTNLEVPSDTDNLDPMKHGYMEGQCSCCRDIRDGELLGWYAELFDGEKVVHKTQSSMNPQATNALQSYLEQAVR